MKKILYSVTAFLYATSLYAQQPCPVIDLGPDQTICYDQKLQTGNITLHAMSSLVQQVSWTSGNSKDSFVKSQDTSYVTFYPSPATLSAGTAKIAVTSVGGGCIAASDTVVITYKAAPVVSAGADTAVCNFQDTISLKANVSGATGINWNVLNGSGHFLPDSNEAAVAFVPDPIDQNNSILIFQVFGIGNGCISSDSIDVGIAIPHVNAGPDQAACNRNIVLQGSASYTTVKWFGGSGEFSPSDQVLNATYIASQADSINKNVTLVLNANYVHGCPPSSDTLIVTFTAPSIKVTADTLLACDSVKLHAQLNLATGVTWSSTGTGYFFGNMYHLSAQDEVNHYVLLTGTTTGNGNCAPVSDSVDIQGYKGISLSAGPDQNDMGGKAVVLNGTSGSAAGTWSSSGSGSFSSTSSLSATYTPSSADVLNGSVNIALSYSGSGICQTGSDTAIIYFQTVFSLTGSVTAQNDTNVVSTLFLYELSNNNYVLSKTQNNVKGQFQLTGIENGNYLLLAAPIQDSTKFQPTYFASSADWQNATTINVSDGDATANINLIPISTSNTSWNKGADAISGTVYLSNPNNTRVSGLTPLANATVILTDDKGQTLTSTRTDANGNYTFANLIAGNYSVKTDYPGTTSASITSVTDGDPATPTVTNIPVNTETITGLFEATSTTSTLQLYPNPVKDVMTVSIPVSSGTASVMTITGGTGTELYKKELPSSAATQQLDVQFLPLGFYILQITNGDSVYRNKFYKTN